MQRGAEGVPIFKVAWFTFPGPCSYPKMTEKDSTLFINNTSVACAVETRQNWLSNYFFHSKTFFQWQKKL